MPRAQASIKFPVMTLSRRKNQYPVKAEAERVIAHITPLDSRTYFTDGLVDLVTHTADAGFAERDATTSMRVTAKVSLLQAELRS